MKINIKSHIIGSLILLAAITPSFEANAATRQQQPQRIVAKKGSQNADRQSYRIYVDDHGVMRRSDTREEVSYYGTNYTAPFAYSYRALGYLDRDRRETIANDVYHIARLGLNAFRLHLWDVELADSAGNLLVNDHLDLLDYMISELERRGIDIVLTAQTNFGNGYPEKDIDTGSYSYRFPKCGIHENTEAQKIQANYLAQLAKHINPYTGRSYADDNAIIAMEINNEPCHSGTKKEVTAYINKMVSALKKAGFEKPILYNVTHNPQVTSAYYDANIDGTTYQWYPTGLVAGHERRGNFLPALDEYRIPWRDTIPGFGKQARLVYEFDPADVTYSHLYPATARTFRTNGFQWITQFAYDPLPLAAYNTEYPTHFLNLVYTPAKALSMMIAAEAAREIPRGANYGRYPENTTFGHTTISYDPDLSIFNSPDKFIYTNDTDASPLSVDNLRLVAGHGNSSIVRYEGTGAYFLDFVDSGVWRLEVLPDADRISDPFANNDLTDAKVIAVERKHPIAISLPALGQNFTVTGLNDGNTFAAKANGKTLDITPGTYLLTAEGVEIPDTRRLGHALVAGNIGLTEFVAPDYRQVAVSLLEPRAHDSNTDVNMIPEEWNFSYEFKDLGYANPKFMSLHSTPSHDGMTVIRRYVGDKTALLPGEIPMTEISVQLTDSIGRHTAVIVPEGALLMATTRDGRTFATPLTTDAGGHFRTSLRHMSEHAGVIVPAPYPTMMAREIPVSATDNKRLSSGRDIEYISIVLPNNAGTPIDLNLERIYLSPSTEVR